MSAHYMPLYIGDYQSDTRHLSTEQHGAYLLILMTMWRQGGSLPNDEKKLARIAGVSLKKWRSISPEIMEFMTVNGDQITQARLSDERQKVESRIDLRRSAGAKGGAAKALKNNKQGVANAIAKLKQPDPEPDPVTASAVSGRAKTDDISQLEPDRPETITRRATALAPKIEAAAKADSQKQQAWAFQTIAVASAWIAKADALGLSPEVAETVITSKIAEIASRPGYVVKQTPSYFNNPVIDAIDRAAASPSQPTARQGARPFYQILSAERKRDEAPCAAR